MEYLALSAYDFDQTQKGWRSLDDKGMFKEAADLIVNYTNMNAHRISSNPSLESLYFHAGQEYATAENEYYDDALKYFNKSYKKDDAWNSYVRGTIAFIEKNQVVIKTEIINLDTIGTLDAQLLIVTLKKLREALLKGIITYKEAY